MARPAVPSLAGPGRGTATVLPERWLESLKPELPKFGRGPVTWSCRVVASRVTESTAGRVAEYRD